MSTLDWMKKKIDNVKDESGEAWRTRSISSNAGDVDKLLAVVDRAEKLSPTCSEPRYHERHGRVACGEEVNSGSESKYLYAGQRFRLEAVRTANSGILQTAGSLCQTRGKEA